MRISTTTGFVSPISAGPAALEQFGSEVRSICGEGAAPLRVAITATSREGWSCEVESASAGQGGPLLPMPSIFEFRRRRLERTHQFTAVMLVPTGVDCAIGGHAGDATPAARVLASVCDQLIVHPNVVNASDINEQTDNSLYVEGSLICRLLTGSIALRKVRSNRLLVVTEARDDGPWAVDQVVNSASAARATLGVSCAEVAVLSNGLSMRMGLSPAGRAVGEIEDLEALFAVLEEARGRYDAVALSTRITPAGNIADLFDAYFGGTGPNPWGGVEAALTHAVSAVFNVPSAHAPTLEDLSLRTHAFGQVDPRKAAESISTSYSYCVLKGLHRAPAVVPDPDGVYDPTLVAAEDVSCVVAPATCLGLPTIAALLQGITVIGVRENTTMLQSDLRVLPFEPGRLWMVDSYLEAAGLISALRAGVDPHAVRRPLCPTVVRHR